MGRARRSFLIALMLVGAMPAGAAQPAQPAPPPASPPAAAPRPATPEAFHAEVVRLYSMTAAQLQNADGLSGQSSLLDGFWTMVRTGRETYVPMLRAELARADNPRLFYFDGAELLRAASDSRADRELALATIIRVGPSHSDPGLYLMALNWYANHGFDIRPAAMQFLDLPPNTTIIVQPFPHVFYYERTQAMIFSLFLMDEHAFVGDLIARLQTERNDLAISALIQCIWATATAQGRAALTAYAADERQPSRARQYAREMLAHRGDGGPPRESEAELRAARRAVLVNAFSHGSIERWHAITDELVKIAEPAPAS